MCATWPVTFGSIDEFVCIWHHFPVCHMAHLSQPSFHNLTVSRGHNKLASFPPNHFSVFCLGPNIPKPNLSTPLRAGRTSFKLTYNIKLKLFMSKSLCFYSETEAGVSKKIFFSVPNIRMIYARPSIQFTLIVNQHNLKGNTERHFALSIKQMAVVNSVSRRRWKAIKHKHHYGLLELGKLYHYTQEQRNE